MQTETKLTSKYVNLLRTKHHAFILNVHGGPMQAAGWPDVYIVHWKFRGWIEFKGQKTRLEPLQIKVMEELQKRRDVVYVVRFLDDKILRISNYNENIIYYTINGETYEVVAERFLKVLEGLSDGPVKH